jgi:hypothetical protein
MLALHQSFLGLFSIASIAAPVAQETLMIVICH